MSGETRPAALDGATRKRVHWDPTINLGHVLTAAAMLTAGFGAWNALDKRLTTLEAARSLSEVHQRERDAAQDQRIRETVEDIRQTTREIKQTVEDLRRERAPR